jgi:serine/threonine protein kinase
MPPPDLEGYTYVDLLGSGGFSDVFLYERDFPRQKVAIKVLVAEALGDTGADRFTAEANVMASLSTHPYIVTIYEARIAPTGHPYLVMEYYPRPNMHVRARSERLPVDVVLRVGIQVASAVESAHRIGVLHRDIKPANILTSAYGRPGLTDFGIAAAEGEHVVEAEGMSIPWASPEIVTWSRPPDERSDVYSLGATMWTLLSGGRSPFEVAGSSNRSIDLIDRIERATAPAVDRPDVPASLQRLLAQALSKDPGARPSSAAAFARALQVIEVEQRFDMTPFEVGDDAGDDDEDSALDDASPTHVKGPTVVEAQSGSGNLPPTADRPFLPPGPMITSAPGAPTGAAPRRTPATLISETPYVPPVNQPRPSVPRPRPAAERPELDVPVVLDESDGPSRGRTALLVAAVVVGLLVLAGIAALLLREDDPEVGASSTTTEVSSSTPSTEAPLEPPTNVRVARAAPDLGDDQWIVTWTAPAGIMADDTYELLINGEVTEVTGATTEQIFTSETSQNCVVVTVVRDGRRSESAKSRADC